ncbi:MAG: DEAD/DEAH box helicase, partial [Sphaerochaeta sp.]
MTTTTTFADLGVSLQTIEAIASKGFTHPTPIQAACIPLLLKDHVDVIGQAQTGTGKTAAFGLPILEIVEEQTTAVQALILAPTRELAIQNAEEIASLKGERTLEIAAVYGGAAIVHQLRQLKKGVHVVVGTPGRILDHLRRGSLVLNHLKFLVLDEADEMLDMGFIEDIEAIMAQAPEDKRTLCFSATMPDPIRRLAERYMKNPEIVRVADETLTTDLTEQLFVEVRESDKFEALTRFIDIEEHFYGIIFCRTKLQCDEVGQKLVERGYNAEALHGDLSQKQRESILN